MLACDAGLLFCVGLVLGGLEYGRPGVAVVEGGPRIGDHGCDGGIPSSGLPCIKGSSFKFTARLILRNVRLRCHTRHACNTPVWRCHLIRHLPGPSAIVTTSPSSGRETYKMGDTSWLTPPPLQIMRPSITPACRAARSCPTPDSIDPGASNHYHAINIQHHCHILDRAPYDF